MKKIIIKDEACFGCGACMGLDEEHFEFGDAGYSVVRSQENLDSSALFDAIDACPVAAISLEEVNEMENSNCENKSTIQEECVCENCNCEDCTCNIDNFEHDKTAA